jgi:hypothetical protein
MDAQEKTELSFNASRFSSSIELDVRVVGFLVDSGDYVLFQQGLTPDAGSDEPPYLEFNDQLYGGYGLVKSCASTPSQIIIELSRPLNGITRLRIGLDKLQADYPEITDQLRKIFAGNPDLLVIENA